MAVKKEGSFLLLSRLVFFISFETAEKFRILEEDLVERRCCVRRGTQKHVPYWKIGGKVYTMSIHLCLCYIADRKNAL